MLTRRSGHWSQLVSDGNPRGYNEKQKQRIADADTLSKKQMVEINVMMKRQTTERGVKEPIDDEYGMDCINAMIADIEAEYAAMAVNDGTTRDADLVGTEDEDEEESDSDSESQSSEK